jgi:cell division protein YceG involved in septum cleavage
MVQRFNQEAATVNPPAAAGRCTRPRRRWTMASLVQPKAALPDYSKIARVIYNRLAHGTHRS